MTEQKEIHSQHLHAIYTSLISAILYVSEAGASLTFSNSTKVFFLIC